MSGYRTLHRETVETTAIWNVTTSPLLIGGSSSNSSSSHKKKQQQQSGQYRVWTASADGGLRSYRVREKSMKNDDDPAGSLDASALSMTCSHRFVGTTGGTEATTATALGCTQVCVARNYVGEDDMAGDLLVSSLDMAGRVRLWKLSEDEDEDKAGSNDTTGTSNNKPKTVRAENEFRIEDATGTVLMMCPPRWMGPGKDVSVAVACLDGTVAQIATGWVTPSRKLDGDGDGNDDGTTVSKATSPPGTLLDRWGSRGSSIALSIASHPVVRGVVAIGRQDGILDTIPIATMISSTSSTQYSTLSTLEYSTRVPGTSTRVVAPPS